MRHDVIRWHTEFEPGTAAGLGIQSAYSEPMIDVALSIMALMASGLVLELFSSASPSLSKNPLMELELPMGYDCEEAGNPS